MNAATESVRQALARVISDHPAVRGPRCGTRSAIEELIDDVTAVTRQRLPDANGPSRSDAGMTPDRDALRRSIELLERLHTTHVAQLAKEFDDMNGVPTLLPELMALVQARTVLVDTEERIETQLAEPDWSEPFRT